ncbi:MAG: hypothetical protein KAS65_05815, partial [Candidatus Aminicenantes bacterium]|nr:hypothetical protein [Candidatus Aminicenantes bacterium]
MKKINVKKFLVVLFLMLLWIYPVYSQIEVLEKNANTNGDTRGIAVQDYHVYLADGAGGFKIVNMSNPYLYVITGMLQMSGCFIEQVAVDGNIVILTDTLNNQIHFVDVSDKMRPELLESLTVTGDVPRRIAAEGGKAFVLEYGDDSTAPGYFSGVEVFSYQTTIGSVQLTPISNIQDVEVNASYVLAAGGNQLQLFRRNATGFNITPARILNFPAGEEIKSLDLYGMHLFAFGKNQLYAIVIFKFQLFPNPPILIVWLLDQIAVSGYQDNRNVNAAILDYGDGTTSAPYIYLLTTTLKSYGMFFFNTSTIELKAFSMYDLESSSWIVFRDVYDASDGKVKIYDSAFPEYFNPGAFKGGTFGLGAIGDYGLGYVQVKQ